MVDLKLANPLSQVFIFALQGLLLVLHSLGNLNLAITASTGRPSRFLIELTPLVVIELHVDESKLLLKPRDFSLRHIFIKGFLGHELATEVLNLKGKLSLDCSVFLSHDVPPNQVELVENLGDASLSHFTVELPLEVLNFLDSHGWNPLIGID